MKVKLETDAWSLLRHGDGADGHALSVLDFDPGFGGGRKRGDG
jgi:hypothetical protein